MNNAALIFSLVTLILTVIVVLVLIILGTRTADKLGNLEYSLETRKLYMGGSIIVALCGAFMVAMGMLFFSGLENGEVGKHVFDKPTVVLPPIGMLILGYYFGSSNISYSKSNKDPQDTTIRGEVHDKQRDM